ncbi:hypothetical protein BRADI_4g36916v3, partial [Brachypodium distachyon]
SFLSAAATSSPFSSPLARAPSPFSLQLRACPPGLLFSPCSSRPAAATSLPISLAPHSSPSPAISPAPTPLCLTRGRASCLTRPRRHTARERRARPRARPDSAPPTLTALDPASPTPVAARSPTPTIAAGVSDPGSAMESRPWSHGVASSAMESQPPPLWCGMVSATAAMETRVRLHVRPRRRLWPAMDLSFFYLYASVLR